MSEDPWTPVRVVDYDLLTRSSSWDDGLVGGSVVTLLRAHTRVLGVTGVDLGASRTVADEHQSLASRYPEQLQRHLDSYGCSASATERND